MQPNFRIDSAYVNDGCSATAESLLPILIRISKHTLARLIASSHQSLGSSAAMKRRDLLLFAGAMTIPWKPATAEAEITRIGFIQPGPRQENQRLLDTFGKSLSALGWTDGKDIAVLDRWARRAHRDAARHYEGIDRVWHRSLSHRRNTGHSRRKTGERIAADRPRRRRRSRLPWDCRKPGQPGGNATDYV